ncbi:MAG: FecR domain-containing protein [Holophagales bacterium]|jgi:hypothetical protein|nr:FecR domain-containing protein [Holophagales bacterium]
MLSSGQIHSLRLASLIAPAAIICPAPGFAQEPDEYLGERPERYAMVRYVEGNVKIRKWDADEDLTAGTPISEGDVIESNGRGVIQLGDGTRIAFGERTRFEVATLFDDQDDRTQALFRLNHGRLRIAVGSQSDAYIRIDTFSGSIELGSRCDVSFDVGLDNFARVKVFSGSVAFRNKLDEISIRAGERLTVYSDNERLDRVRPFNTYEVDTFETWAEKQMAYKRSKSSEYVPSQIRYYADTLDGRGDWVNVVDVGWCWRPYVTIANWRPYWRGYWGAHRGGMTWISYDPFGYITHHYGRWGWNSYYGWYWIPGVYYSPAWVVWNISGSFFGWAPLGYYNRPVYWGYSNWHHDLWNVVDIRHIRNRQIYNHTVWDRSLSGHFPTYNANRSITPAWKRGPLLVTRQEFNNPDPSQFRRALSREVSAERFKAYEQQTGRGLVKRDTPAGAPGVHHNVHNRPFEDQSSRRILAERSVLRESARTSESRRNGSRAVPGSNRENHGGTPDNRRNITSRDTSRNPDTPNRRMDMSEERRSEPRQEQGRRNNTTPPSQSSGSRELPQNNAQPNRSVEKREAPKAERRESSRAEGRPTTPAPSSHPRTAAPPPDRSRNSRR